MGSNRSSRRAGAFTLVELLCVIAIIALLAALILTAVNDSQARARRIDCANNLREMGIGFHAFAHDHNGQFPMAVPMADGGAKEFVESGYRVGYEFYFSYRQFQVLSNELVKPKLLICPADRREPAANFGVLQNSNLSYFVGVQAEFARPRSVLAGDRNLMTNASVNPTILRLDSCFDGWWTEEMHRLKGNVLFADGHVEGWNTPELMAEAHGELLGSDFFLPSVKFATDHPAPPVAGGAGGPPPGPQSAMTRPNADARAPVAASIPQAVTFSPAPPSKPGPNGWTDPSPAPPANRRPAFSRETTTRTGPENPPTEAMTNWPATNPPADATVAAAAVTPEETTVLTTNERSLRVVHRTVGYSYLLLLLLLLASLILRRWLRSRSERERRPS